jgi:DNA-binding CsgD family transcriptional regulator
MEDFMMSSGSFYELIESLSKSETVEELHAVCTKLCAQFGFDCFNYGARFPASFVKPYYVFICGYPSEWWSRYISKDYLLIDPVVAYGTTHITPVRWDQLQPREYERERVNRFMGEAHEFGLCSGVSFPTHSSRSEVSLLSFASERDHRRARADIQHATPYAQYFNTYLHEAIRRIFEKQILQLARVHLTQKERECLLWSAEGKTTWEISVILRLSERTVRFHLHNASKKLNTVSRQHAVARAVSLGLINPHLD